MVDYEIKKGEYFFEKKLFGTGYTNRVARIFLDKGTYNLYHGWENRNNKSFNKIK